MTIVQKIDNGSTSVVSASGVSTSRRNPDIAILIYDFRGSGVIRNALRIAEAARIDGLFVEFVVVRHEGPFADTEIPVSVIGDSHDFGRAIDTFRATRRLHDYVDARKPRILFSAGNHIHHIVGPALRRAIHRPIVIMRASNDMEHYRTRGYGPLEQKLRSAVVRRIARFMFDAADHIVAVSPELADQVEGYLRSPVRQSPPVQSIFNGIDNKAIRALARSPVNHPWFGTSDIPVIVGMGRFARQKNFTLLISAFAKLLQRTPARLVLLGKGPELEALSRHATALGCADYVDFPGYVSNPFPYLSAASLFVLSSTWEGCSNALLEAMACGCPVVATRCPTGTIDILDHGRRGPLVDVDDYEELAAAMRERLESPRNSEQLRAWSETHDIQRTVAGYLDVFRSALAGAPGADISRPKFDQNRPPSQRAA
ncbi:MAG: glycosyltransferase [Rhodobacteraceae bacterium]|nr:glycosyltransferase [Paracoccaceae bacterium]